MGTTKCFGGNTKVYKGKNGYTSTSVKIKVDGGKSIWKKCSSSPKQPRRKK